MPDYLETIGGGLVGTKVGVVRDSHLVDADPAVVDAFEVAVSVLEGTGAEVVEVSIPLYNEVSAAAMVTMLAEACAYHHNDLVKRWGDYFHVTRTMVAWGALISGADYVQAQRVRRVGQQVLADVLAAVGLIVTPTATTGAPPVEGLGEDLSIRQGKVHTPYWNAVGNPVLALPIGFVDGMPMSIQIAGSPFAEADLLRAGHAYQVLTDWHLRVPDLATDPVAT